jgi:hypothetical protein
MSVLLVRFNSDLISVAGGDPPGLLHVNTHIFGPQAPLGQHTAARRAGGCEVRSQPSHGPLPRLIRQRLRPVRLGRLLQQPNDLPGGPQQGVIFNVGRGSLFADLSRRLRFGRLRPGANKVSARAKLANRWVGHDQTPSVIHFRPLSVLSQPRSIVHQIMPTSPSCRRWLPSPATHIRILFA